MIVSKGAEKSVGQNPTVFHSRNSEQSGVYALNLKKDVYETPTALITC